MSDASPADLHDQELPVIDDDDEEEGLAPIELEPEVPEADAVEQHQPAPVDERYEQP